MIFLIEPDEPSCEALGNLLAAATMPYRTFHDLPTFLNSCGPSESGVMLMNSCMGTVTALDALELLGARGTDRPVVVHGGDRNAPQIVRTMRAGAFDYLPYPVHPVHFVASLDAALAEEERRREPRKKRLAALAKLAELTHRQREVLERLLQGERNKTVAERFCVVPKTIEHHRATIFRKLGVKSLAAAAVHCDIAMAR